ncbi:GcvT family protein [Kribbella speibonae]|uniref:FAD-dependent oxidoreductase n=1 Tax=Kribbella speibonae TaxID=1572660 RepID=A0A4V2M4M0_9ACTN|nr:FAD-dependent oxidoreductase [Kribbella speibonae]TCC36452.1 FAD-dependent oxidoreductase [Kribbella speibonae]
MDRLVDKSLTARRFAPDAGSRPVPSRARTVVVGGGIMGASTAYHLAVNGDDDVLLLERNVIGSGTTWHAAGLAASVRTTPPLTELAGYGIATYKRLQADSGVDVSFNQCGSISLARSRGRLDELRYAAAVAEQMGRPAELIDAEEVVRRFPLAVSDNLLGGLHHAEDGHVNPGHVALAFAKLAYEAGALVRENVSVTQITCHRGAVTGVDTAVGHIECERVVVASGLWSRELMARSGATLPLYAAEHVHVRTGPVEGAHAGLPILRDLDGYLYVRHEAGRLLVGAFEPNGLPRSLAEIGTSGFMEFPANWDHFAPIRRTAEERVPILRSAGYKRFLNAPEAFTPDGHFCLGESADLRNLFVGAGFNSQGIIYGPGAGRALAEWMIGGGPTFDSSAVDVQRFAKVQNNQRYLRARTTEALGRLYAMHWPNLQPVTARDVRRSPLHHRLIDANACFGERVGWERADWYAEPLASAAYEYSYGKQNWFDNVRREHEAARTGVALFDLSSFTKVEVAGADALDILQHMCTADVDLKVGRVKYTLMLNGNGGIELDGTVVRLGEDRFWVITPAAAQTKTLAMLKHLTRGRGAAAFDATSAYATIAVMGPRSRELMTRVSADGWSNEEHAYGHAREVEVGDGTALALRISFVGELGYELYVPSDQAVNVYDAIVSAGTDLGLRHAGYLALDSLRSEKGFRHLGHDIGPHDDPYEAGLGFTISKRKAADFSGRSALAARTSRSKRTVFVALRDPDVVFVHDETIFCNGLPVGRVTSGSYGYTIGRACGIGVIDADTPEAGDFHIDCGGVCVPADVSARPFYDPDNQRLRG